MVGWDGIEPPTPGFSDLPTVLRMPGKYDLPGIFFRRHPLERAQKRLNRPPMVTIW
jgi:hypothetical protein